jgi:hypothetical protein
MAIRGLRLLTPTGISVAVARRTATGRQRYIAVRWISEGQNDGGKLPDLPPLFSSWPLERQADWIAFQLNRDETLGLFRQTVDATDRRGDRVSKHELARAICIIHQYSEQ